jgi:rubredoxin
MPPGYYEIPEYECPTCGPLYADEVEAGECKICGESVFPDMEDE